MFHLLHMIITRATSSLSQKSLLSLTRQFGYVRFVDISTKEKNFQKTISALFASIQLQTLRKCNKRRKLKVSFFDKKSSRINARIFVLEIVFDSTALSISCRLSLKEVCLNHVSISILRYPSHAFWLFFITLI